MTETDEKNLAQALRLAQLAVEPTKIAQAIDPLHEYFAINGRLEKIAKPKGKTRSHQVCTLESFAKLVNQLACDETAVWHNDSQITASLTNQWTNQVESYDAQEHKAVMQLLRSPFWTAVKRYEKPQSIGQKELLALLKQEFGKDNRLSNQGLISLISQLKFTRNESGVSTVNNGRESLGRSVEAELRGLTDAGDIPESFQVLGWLYSNDDLICPATKVKVEIFVTPDLESQTFRLAASPEDLLAATQITHQWIGKELIQILDESISVFFGTP